MAKVRVSISYPLVVKKARESTVLIWFLVGLALLPFVYWPVHFEPFELPKVWFFSRWVEGLWLVTVLSRRKAHSHYSRLLLALLGFGVLAAVLALVGLDPVKSVMGNYYRQDGLITLFHLTALAVFIGCYWLPQWDRWFFETMTWVFGVLAAGVLGEAAQSGFTQAVALFGGNENFLAGTLLMGLPVVGASMATPGKKSKLAVVSLLLLHLAILLTRSWGAGLGVAVYWLGWAALHHKRRLLFLGLILGALIVFGYSLEVSRRGWSGEGRERIIVKVFSGVGERWLTGLGWANVDYAFEAGKTEFEPGIEPYVDKAHNEALEVFSTTGIVGLSLYGLVWVLALQRVVYFGRDGWNQREEMVALGLLVYGVHAQVNVLSISESMWFYLFLGLLIAPRMVAIRPLALKTGK